MPSEASSSKDSNLKIIALVAAFLLISLVAVLFYYQNYMKSDTTTNQTTSTSYDSDTWTTHTSKTHGYSISYPKTWTKVVTATSPDSSGHEIVLFNLKDTDSRDNGKPNIILTAGAPSGACTDVEDGSCKELSDSVFVSIAANGDQATIDAVLETFKTN